MSLSPPSWITQVLRDYSPGRYARGRMLRVYCVTVQSAGSQHAEPALRVCEGAIP